MCKLYQTQMSNCPQRAQRSVDAFPQALPPTRAVQQVQ
jgi:hypothetical protein